MPTVMPAMRSPVSQPKSEREDEKSSQISMDYDTDCTDQSIQGLEKDFSDSSWSVIMQKKINNTESEEGNGRLTACLGLNLCERTHSSVETVWTLGSG